ncbi:hypothetical protein QVA57_05170 [Staphylococcus ureilyticus]|nr:hypothetical protein [Staphylococcus ureilyticus]MDU0462074.1 hypothetical protein [Staphylococcus ureilyticus]
MAIKEKDKIIEVNALEIPDELKQLPKWVLWRAEWDNKQKQYKKVPYSYAGYRASSTESETWTIFDAIHSLYEKNHSYNGIGFVLSNDDDYICLDIDDAVNPDTGQLQTDLALEMTELTYCELSPSGTGLHCFFKGELPSERKKKRSDLDIELYNNARFMTVTGESIGQSEICEVQATINNIVERYFKVEEPVKTFTIHPNRTNDLSDDEVLDIMMKSKNKDKISDLLKGNYEKYFDSPSEGVQSLLHYLAFYTSKDKGQMERLFLDYNNLTDKWNSKRGNTTWGQLELDKAISNQSEVFKNSNYDFNFEKSKSKKLKKGSWWIYPDGDTNYKPSFAHTIMAEYILQEKSIVRYPDADGEIYIYSPKSGIYEIDKTGRKMRSIIRNLEILKDNAVKEVRNYIIDTCDIKTEVNTDYVAAKNGLVHFKSKSFKKFTPDIFVISKIPTAYNPNAYDEFIDTTIQKVSCNHEATKINIYMKCLHKFYTPKY